MPLAVAFGRDSVFRLGGCCCCQLRGHAALVTGAGGSIGRAICRLFVKHGAAVACADLDGAAATAVADEARGDGDGDVAAVMCDVTSEVSTREAVAETITHLGRLDILVNCAAAPAMGRPIAALSADEWRATMNVNLTGAFLISKAAVPEIARHGGGSVILLASQFGRVATGGQAAYGSSKAGVIQLARVLAIEHAADGVRVNSLSPGAIASERLRRRYGTDEEADAALSSRYPLRRLGQPDEVAQAALFLAGDRSSFITGSDLLTDGGYTAQ